MPFDGKADGRAYAIFPRMLEDPSVLTNYGKLYTKLDGGITQLFFQSDDGTVTQITPSSAANLVDSVFGRIGNVVAVSGDYTGDLVTNDSGVAGASVKDALDTLLASIAALTSSGIANASAVVGATVTAALNTLNTALGALTSTSISNVSTVVGATVTAALDTLAGIITALTSDDVANASNVPGAAITNALNNLYSLGLKGITTHAATHVITSSDSNRLHQFTAAGAVNLTINNNVLAEGDIVYWCTTGAGTLTIDGTATLRSRGGLLSSNGQYSYGAIVMLSATEALIVGDRA